MARVFDPVMVEAEWYYWWHDDVRAFAYDAKAEATEKPFSMILPPPNVTGALHVGHALTVAVQDALARWQRMCGRPVLWVPGLDHAGIATQAVVERRLLKEGLTRHDLGRDEFLERVWGWKDEYARRIRGQLCRLGASVDWEREYFTLDEPRSRAVTAAFRRLFARGLVYRGERMVSWCPALRTALSDIEVETREIPGPTEVRVPAAGGGGAAPGEGAHQGRSVELGWMDSFAYRLADGGGADGGDVLVVATTRLETMLADSAVAVHPDDARYTHFVGRDVLHPLTGRRIPVIADADLVDPAKGTGAVKVTPAHDPADWECGTRHGLPAVAMLDEAGRIASPGAWPGSGAEVVPPSLVGLDRFDAREAVRGMLREAGSWQGREPNPMAVAVCSRTGDVLEPMLLPQWWVRTGPLAEAVKRVEADDGSERMRILPAAGAREWRRWLDEPRDWCVSRQLWWGHRVPAWRVTREGPLPAGAGEAGGPDGGGGCPDGWRVFEGDEWVCAAAEEEALAIADEAGRVLGGGAWPRVLGVAQDDDVLDTWFSSGLLPLSALGWEGDDAALVGGPLPGPFPLTVMETGEDILFFWVARMAMLCEGAGLPGPPFEQVLLHGMVRDAEGRKMSKSLGNVIDPLAVMDGSSLAAMLAALREGNLPPAEAEHAERRIRADFPDGMAPSGADALRGALLHLMRGNSPDVNMDISRVTGWRLFANKLWNATRFVTSYVDAAVPFVPRPEPAAVPRIGVPALPDVASFDRQSVPLPVRWVLGRAARACIAYNKSMAAFDPGAAAAGARAFVVGDLCDVALEWCKPALRGFAHVDGGRAEGPEAAAVLEEAIATAAGLAAALDAALRLLHPTMPYVTEELWHRLHSLGVEGDRGTRAPAPALAVAPFPVIPGPMGLREDMRSDTWARATDAGIAHWAADDDDGDEAAMQKLLGVVGALRSIEVTARQAAGKALKSQPRAAVVVCADERTAELVRSHEREIAALVRLEARLDVRVAAPAEAAAALAGALEQPVTAGLSVGLRMPPSPECREAVVRDAARVRTRAAKKRKRAQARRAQLDKGSPTAGALERGLAQAAEAEADAEADEDLARRLERSVA